MAASPPSNLRQFPAGQNVGDAPVVLNPTDSGPSNQLAIARNQHLPALKNAVVPTGIVAPFKTVMLGKGWGHRHEVYYSVNS